MMNEQEMASAADDIDRIVKVHWPHGWGSLLRQGGKWIAHIYDNGLNNRQFWATTAADALQQARAYLEENQPMTEARLASILGIDLAAAE